MSATQTLDMSYLHVGVWFCFDLSIIVPWFVPLEVRSIEFTPDFTETNSRETKPLNS